ncbi:hypothetical protein K474DRAFT_420107 [Panus rudis PR-1116 ss-1]|nr:hypothetical protein K474DRAFT_420107 [Panus rudis PR-1116 ss-1]
MPRGKRRKTGATDSHETVKAPTSGETVSNGSTAARRNVRGRRGGLQDLPKMPLDILLEIFSHVHPMDLLNLARTSQAFRRFLLSRTEASLLWRAARANVPELPNIPDNISEPAFANLLFDPHCHSCLKPVTSEPIWIFRKRYCKDCKLSNIELMHDVIMSDPMGRFFSPMAPCPLPYAVNAISIRGQRKEIVALHAPDLEQLRAEFNKLNTDAEKNAFIQEQRSLSTRLRTQYDKCSSWFATRKVVRQCELDNMRAARFQAIEVRLKEEGWGPALEFMTEHQFGYFSGHPLQDIPIVRQPKPLTSRTWPRVYKEILPALERAEQGRMKMERKDLMKSRLEILERLIEEFKVSCRFFFPGLRQVAQFPDFVEIIRAPSDVNITEDSFRALRHRLRDVVTTWEATQRRILSRHIEHALDEDSVDSLQAINPLELAIGTYFVCPCQDCPDVPADGQVWPHTIRSAIAHSSAQTSSERMFSPTTLGPKTDLERAPPNVLLEFLECSSPDVIQFGNPWVAELIADLVRKCGLDPLSATPKEMDELQARFVCEACTIANQESMVLTWRSAVLHTAQRHCSYPPLSHDFMWFLELEYQFHLDEFSYKLWQPKSNTTEDLVLAAEARMKGVALVQQETILPIWHCARCIENHELERKSDVLVHLRDS